MTPDQLAATAAFAQTAERLPQLYRLSEEFNGLIDLLEDGADEQEVTAEIERVAGDIKRKAFGIASVITTLERLSEMQLNEAKRLASKAKSNEAHAARLRQYVLDNMRAVGQERIETGVFTLSIRKNNPSVVVENAMAVPIEFNRTKITVEPDKTAIMAHYKQSGEVVPGVSIVRTERLDLR